MTHLYDVFASGQYMENYGAHDWDGEGECPQYWKCKGSSERVVVRNLPFDEAVRYFSEDMSSELPEIESNDYVQWYPNSFMIFPAGLTSFQRIDVIFGCFDNLTDEQREAYQRVQQWLGNWAETPEEDREVKPLPYEEYYHLEGWK